MRCPKCEQEQDGIAECKVCGVIVQKYHGAQQRKIEEEKRKAKIAAKKKAQEGIKTIEVAFLFIVAAVATYYFVFHKPHKVVDQKKSMQAEKLMIEHARKAIVTLETPWGKRGTGFFLTGNSIVTNKHVVELDPKEREKYNRMVEHYQVSIEENKRKLKVLENQLDDLDDFDTRERLRQVITLLHKQQQRMAGDYEDVLEKLRVTDRPVRPSDFRIVLFDDTVVRPYNLIKSESHNLAVFSVYVQEPSVISRPPENSKINQGDRVFTLGSPVGSQNPVISGVLSGYRTDAVTGLRFLQTTAAVHPENMGGPLIDEHGNVCGVNAGVGYAIPVEVVFGEFRSVLIQRE